MNNNKQDAQKFFIAGLNKQKIEDFHGAITDYNKAIKLNPTFAEAYFSRGIAKIYLKDFNAAIADFNKAIEVNPKYAKAYSNRAFSHYQLGQYDNAEKDIKSAEDIDYDNIKTKNIKNLVLEAKKERENQEIKGENQENFIQYLTELNYGKEATENGKFYKFRKCFRGFQESEIRWFFTLIIAIVISIIIYCYEDNSTKSHMDPQQKDTCITYQEKDTLITYPEENNFIKEYAPYALFIFIISFISMQYGRAKKLRIETDNRIAVARSWFIVKNNTSEQEIFGPQIAETIFGKTLISKDKNSPPMSPTHIIREINKTTNE